MQNTFGLLTWDNSGRTISNTPLYYFISICMLKLITFYGPVTLLSKKNRKTYISISKIFFLNMSKHKNFSKLGMYCVKIQKFFYFQFSSLKVICWTLNGIPFQFSSVQSEFLNGNRVHTPVQFTDCELCDGIRISENINNPSHQFRV